MDVSIQVEIITPEKSIFSGPADLITLPTASGQITVLPNHQALVGALTAGEIIIKHKDREIFLAVSDGLIQVQKNHVRVLTDTAERAEDIDEARAAQAHRRASEIMQDKRENVDYTALTAKIEKELARLRIARRRKHHASPEPRSE